MSVDPRYMEELKAKNNIVEAEEVSGCGRDPQIRRQVSHVVEQIFHFKAVIGGAVSV